MKIIMIVVLIVEIMMLPWFIRTGWQMVKYIKALRSARTTARKAGSMFHTSGRWRSDMRRCVWGLTFASVAVALDAAWVVVTVIFIQVL